MRTSARHSFGGETHLWLLLNRNILDMTNATPALTLETMTNLPPPRVPSHQTLSRLFPLPQPHAPKWYNPHLLELARRERKGNLAGHEARREQGDLDDVDLALRRLVDDADAREGVTCEAEQEDFDDGL